MRNHTTLKKLSCLLALLIAAVMLCSCAGKNVDLASIPLEKSLQNGMPTLAEFGWRECIPCKEMKPVLEELAAEYRGKVNILIVEIPYHEDLADKYEIKVMPEQIFFNSNGEIVYRHRGFLPKEDIVGQFKKMGIQ